MKIATGKTYTCDICGHKHMIFEEKEDNMEIISAPDGIPEATVVAPINITLTDFDMFLSIIKMFGIKYSLNVRDVGTRVFLYDTLGHVEFMFNAEGKYLAFGL